MSLGDLSDDILKEIISYCDRETQFFLRESCKRLAQLVSAPAIPNRRFPVEFQAGGDPNHRGLGPSALEAVRGNPYLILHFRDTGLLPRGTLMEFACDLRRLRSLFDDSKKNEWSNFLEGWNGRLRRALRFEDNNDLISAMRELTPGLALLTANFVASCGRVGRDDSEVAILLARAGQTDALSKHIYHCYHAARWDAKAALEIGRALGPDCGPEDPKDLLEGHVIAEIAGTIATNSEPRCHRWEPWISCIDFDTPGAWVFEGISQTNFPCEEWQTLLLEIVRDNSEPSDRTTIRLIADCIRERDFDMAIKFAALRSACHEDDPDGFWWSGDLFDEIVNAVDFQHWIWEAIDLLGDADCLPQIMELNEDMPEEVRLDLRHPPPGMRCFDVVVEFTRPARFSSSLGRSVIPPRGLKPKHVRFLRKWHAHLAPGQQSELGSLVDGLVRRALEEGAWAFLRELRAFMEGCSLRADRGVRKRARAALLARDLERELAELEGSARQDLEMAAVRQRAARFAPAVHPDDLDLLVAVCGALSA
uniref:F-box domain-containing protein n=1 Tax=Tetraselmis sp. GSL018 TaxID=582737 RepID=A0A061R6S3_9CHLO|mmetsp:Transcript_21297/g.50822  ORF Transcript_21297/g.50822 Transcript_21297/m.50822 type:complete len:535 (-) Transcript_21297:37-1641(-)